MKAILMSIQPKWCEKIANGEKTIEVRKTRPKIETPFKVYIYCTKKVLLTKSHYNGLIYISPKKHYQQALEAKGNQTLSGQVIGEFVCDKIEEFTVGSLKCDDIEALAWLKHSEMIDYFYKPEELDGKTVKVGYAWHISALKIYDKPKELGEFRKPCDYAGKGYACYPDNCERCPWNTVTRPPRSWEYCDGISN